MVRVEAADDVPVRVPERVLVARGNDRQGWGNGVEKGFRGGGSRSMMADLEDVGVNKPVLTEDAKLHGPLQIAGEQEASVSIDDPEGEGIVVSGRRRGVVER